MTRVPGDGSIEVKQIDSKQTKPQGGPSTAELSPAAVVATNVAAAFSAELIARLAGVTAPTGLSSAVGATFHSGRIRPGEAFFALPGAVEHGHSYAEQALDRGAAFIVSDRPHPRGVQVPDSAAALLALGRFARARLRGPVVAVSGSVGKTSTKAFVAAALDGAASAGNFNTPLALACTLVQAWLADPSRPLVLELGIDHPGEMDELLDLVEPSHGLLTAIAESHLERLGDLEGVAREKGRLLERATERIASFGAAQRLTLRPAGLVRYGFDHQAEVVGRTEPNGEGQRLEALGVLVDLPYPGRAMAENALAALTVARRLGVDLRTAASRIEVARIEPGRLQRRAARGRLIIDDSYNANPASARAALEVLTGSPGPHCAVLGDMLELGTHSERLHRELGAATLGLDTVIAVGESARFIAQENPRALHATDAAAAAALLDRLPEGGTVLVKGSRGMRLERIVSALLGNGDPGGSSK